MVVNIIYGVRSMSDDARKEIREKLEERGCWVRDEIVREIKSGVDSQVDNYNSADELVLVLMLNLESTNPFSITDLLHYQRVVPAIKIILVVDEEDKGKELLKTMSDNGMYLALYAQDTEPDLIAKMIVEGRSIVEAKEYYGVKSFMPQQKTLTLDSALTHMKQPVKEPKEYVERMIWVQAALPSDAMFEELLKRLPDNIKDALAESERYAGYLRDYIAMTTGSAKKDADKLPRGTGGLISAGEVKDVVSRAVRYTVIGVTGAQEHVGTTHQALLIAHYLGGLGYRVAVVEDATQKNFTFATIASGEGKQYQKNYMSTTVTDREERQYVELFTNKGVDYYPEFSMENISALNKKGYNFIVVDFGVFGENMLTEFVRCSLHVVVTGAKVWETPHLDNIFERIGDQEQLKTYNYLFMSVPIHARRYIARRMGTLSHVFYGDYEPNPFAQEAYPAIHMILKNFNVGEEEVKEKGLLEKVKGFFA